MAMYHGNYQMGAVGVCTFRSRRQISLVSDKKRV